VEERKREKERERREMLQKRSEENVLYQKVDNE